MARKQFRRKVKFEVEVSFVCDTEAGLEQLIKEYPSDPSIEAFGCHTDWGCYSIKRGKISPPDRRVDK
jgi:hypothetical protein